MAADSMTTPLLQSQGGPSSHQRTPDDGWQDEFRDKASLRDCNCWPVVLVEAKKQLLLAAPMIGVNVFQLALTTVSIMFVGHLDELSLASASICTSFAIVTGYSVMVSRS